MKLYKYRSLENIEYTLDILLNERLHCAPYENLNDPFEGVFLSVYSTSALIGSSLFNAAPIGGETTVKSPQTIAGSALPIPGGTRICSLSASLSDVRLWSHYANGHTGIAIEIDFDDTEGLLHKVEYVNQLQEISQGLLANPKTTEILSKKTNHWDHEEEYRIISDEEFHSILGKITGVYLGLRTPELLQNMLLRLTPYSTPIFTTKLNEKTVEVEQLSRLNKDSFTSDSGR